MRNALYVIYDKTARKSGPVFEAENDSVAIRRYQLGLKEIDDPYKEDYALYRLAYFDQYTMGINSENFAVNNNGDVDITSVLVEVNIDMEEGKTF